MRLNQGSTFRLNEGSVPLIMNGRTLAFTPARWSDRWTNFLRLVLLGWVAFAPSCVNGEEVRVLSLSQNGLITWSNSTLNVTCRVEWASTVDGPWNASWDSLSNVVVTNGITQRSVPMFYRVVATLPPAPPLITNITASATLKLITDLATDPDFVILDVRTPGEYAPRHIKKAVNLDYNAAGFSAQLDALDKAKTYLVYCASGNRASQALNLMKGKGFLRVYRMSEGFSTFASLPGAAIWLEP